MADGVQLLGAYQGSGLTDPPYLIRHPDGRIMQVTRLLHLLAATLDGAHSVPKVADRVSAQYGRTVSPDNVTFLISQKLQPLGLISDTTSRAPSTPPPPILGLRIRKSFVPQKAVRAATRLLRPLFRPAVVITTLAAVAGIDIWLFVEHGFGAGFQEALTQPTAFLLLFGLLLVSGAFHELGHATACHYGGATPGAMGAGLYLIWPAFFSEVTDSYRLSRSGRLRTDLGGVYFNAVFVVGVAAAYFATGFEPLLFFIVLQHLQVAYQFVPFVRLDGYYVVSDLAGVPDLFARLRPVLASLVPGRSAPAEITELRPGARRLITAWVGITVPVLVASVGLFLVRVPRVLDDVGASVMLQVRALEASVAAGHVVGTLLAAISATILVLPLVGASLTLCIVAGRLGRHMKASTRRKGTAVHDGLANGPTAPPVRPGNTAAHPSVGPTDWSRRASNPGPEGPWTSMPPARPTWAAGREARVPMWSSVHLQRTARPIRRS